MKNHILYKSTETYTQGTKPKKHLPYYVILEEFPAPDSPGGKHTRFAGGWKEEWMRDLMFDAMVLNNKCSHSKRQPRLRLATEPKRIGTSVTDLKDGEQCIIQKLAARTGCPFSISEWLKREHPDVLARYEAAGLYFDEGDVVWMPPVSAPAIKGWSKMKAGEKHKAAQEAGCGYCLAKSSARSCPIHGWPEKWKAANRLGINR
jgi:hypothetical protein